MTYEANEAPTTEVVKKLQVKQITSTGTKKSTTENTTEGPNEGPNESTDRSTNEDTKEVIEFKTQAIERDIKIQLKL